MGCRSLTRITTSLALTLLFFSLMLLKSSDTLKMDLPIEWPDHIRHSGTHRDRTHSGHLPAVVRYYKLLNLCSGRHLQITGKLANARARFDDQYTQLRVETDAFDGRLRLQSALSQTYLCFNKLGQLVVKHLAKDEGCVFKEVNSPNNGYSEFQSTLNSTWYVGFNGRGQKLSGNQWTSNAQLRRCYHFTKTFSSDLTIDKTSNKQGPKIDYGRLSSVLRTTRKPTLRTRKHRERT